MNLLCGFYPRLNCLAKLLLKLHFLILSFSSCGSILHGWDLSLWLCRRTELGNLGKWCFWIEFISWHLQSCIENKIPSHSLRLNKIEMHFNIRLVGSRMYKLLNMSFRVGRIEQKYFLDAMINNPINRHINSRSKT